MVIIETPVGEAGQGSPTGGCGANGDASSEHGEQSLWDLKSHAERSGSIKT